MQHEETRLHSLLSKKIADLVKVVDKLFRSNHTAQLENVFLRKDLVEFEALRKENEALKEKVDALEGKVREADERLKHECEKLKELHRLEMDKLYEEMKSREEAILDELRERDHALSDMEHELGRKTMQTKELQSNLSEYKKRYKAASSSGRDAKEENNGLVSELMAVKSSMESMEEEIEAMRLEKNGLKKKFERQWDVERASWKGEKCKLREKIDALQDQVQKLQSRLLRTTHSSQGSHESVGSCESSHSTHKRQGVSSGAVMVRKSADSCLLCDVYSECERGTELLSTAQYIVLSMPRISFVPRPFALIAPMLIIVERRPGDETGLGHACCTSQPLQTTSNGSMADLDRGTEWHNGRLLGCQGHRCGHCMCVRGNSCCDLSIAI